MDNMSINTYTSSPGDHRSGFQLNFLFTTNDFLFVIIKIVSVKVKRFCLFEWYQLIVF